MTPLIIVCAVVAQTHGASAADPKQVLVLSSARRDVRISTLADRNLVPLLQQGVADGVDYYSEYIDPARFPDPSYQAAVRDFLRVKYKGQHFDVVITLLDVAADFVERHRNELFPETPVVFYVTNPRPRRLANATGVVTAVDLRSTLAMAIELQPDTRQVFVISGASSRDKVYENLARAQFQPFESRLTFTYLSDLPANELAQRLSTLPPQGIAYYLLFYQDDAGNNFNPVEQMDRFAARANRPMYSWVDTAMGRGVVGGSLRDLDAVIAAVANQAQKVLRGERADSIPILAAGMSVNQVDWRQLRRWGISEARLPAGTRILFREPSAWERYKLYITGVTALVLTQSALIVGLVVQRARRRRAETRLRASQADLRDTYARLLGAEEAERFRIARELHDDIGQRLAVLTMELDGLGGGRPALAAADLRARIRALSDRSLELAKDVQFTSRNLHTSDLEYLGLGPAAAAFCREVSQQRGVVVDFSAADIPDDLPREVASCLFRVLQEGVNNAGKHARARCVTVALRSSRDGIQLEIVDNGIGFDPGATSGGPGLGLISMRERLSIVDGELFIESRPGAGATIRARVPLGGADRFSSAAIA